MLTKVKLFALQKGKKDKKSKKSKEAEKEKEEEKEKETSEGTKEKEVKKEDEKKASNLDYVLDEWYHAHVHWYSQLRLIRHQVNHGLQIIRTNGLWRAGQKVLIIHYIG